MDLHPKGLNQNNKGQISKNEKLPSNGYHDFHQDLNFFPAGDFSVWPFLGSEHNH